ncbi:MAG TPA: M3 family oligoendopeptidase, partial [Bacteroidia bacterium]|nr:M3 family oligoendopeptidase [Bacteroidia bacterium]
MTSNTIQAPEKIRRNFLPATLDLTTWDAVEPFYLDLTGREINSLSELQRWLSDITELDSVIQEHVGWLYIRMTCDTTDKKLTEAYTHFVENIIPKIEPFADQLNKKLVNCSYKTELDKRYILYLKQVENSIRIFREENIPVQAELSVKEQKYGEIAGAMTVDVDGKTLTLQQAANFLKNPSRELREDVYHKIQNRRLQDREKLDTLFSELVALRHRMAQQAGFANYRDYKFVDLDRFDYTPEDCQHFHESVRTAIVPVLDTLFAERKAALNLDTLKPWDLDVDTMGRDDMKPFKKGEELMAQTISCFTEIDPYFGEVTRTLEQMHYVDLDSRIGKAPGGYNYPLYESGVPFIFMNASGSLRDVVTMVHEGGHAIHSMLTRDLDFIGFKEIPSEIAELASMSMELISMEHWHHFFSNPDDLKRARREQLENVLEALP